MCLSNLENLNAVFINEGMPQAERLAKLNAIAISQMKVLTEDHRLLQLEEHTHDSYTAPLDRDAANFVVFSRRNLENLQWYSMTHGGNRKVAAFVVFGIL